MPLQQELEEVEKSLENVQKNRNKYLDLYESNLIDQELFKGRITELNNELESLVIHRNELESALKGCNSDELSYEYVKQVLANIDIMLDAMESDEKKVFYHMIIEEIVVSQDKKIESIKLKIDEEMQKELITQSLSDKTSDRDIFVSKNSFMYIRIII